MAKITHIEKIKNLAVFADYTRDKSLEPFERYNLIYGWNGSGKTALSRLFASLESGKHSEFPDLEYQVSCDGKRFTQTDAFDTKVRVFNTDYIERNVKVIEGHASPIYVLGEKSQEVFKQIEKDETALNGVSGDEDKPGLIEQKRRLVEEQTKTKKERDGAFTQIAKTISAAWSAAGATRNYRRPDAIKAFGKLTSKKLLEEDDLTACSLTLSQSVEPALDPLSIPKIASEDTDLGLNDALTSLIDNSNAVLTTIVQKVAINRLNENQDISDWVEQGIGLHKDHASKQCEYCGQVVPKDRLDALEKHFSDADRILKQNIGSAISYIASIKAAVNSVNPYDEAKLYKQFRSSFKTSVADFDAAKKKLAKSLDKLQKIVEGKKTKTTESITYSGKLDGTAINDAVVEINRFIKKHNKITANHEGEQASARLRIENHYLSTILDEVEKKDDRLSEIKVEIGVLENGDPEAEEKIGIEALKKRIKENRATVSSAHKSCDQVNEKIKTLCGRDEISFVVTSNSDGETVGYGITRSGKPAKSISEGEKTAIAFAHFCITLTEQEFAIKNGIVVIDDPISSLDSAILFKVCAAIKKQMRSAAQLFILTHNFEFFNHIKGWYFNDPVICGKKGEDDEVYRLYMVQNDYDASASRRVAMLDELDPMLRDYESEYHYLFKKLVDFDTDNPEPVGVKMHAIYDYPTIARKLLECFLSFRVPVRGSFYTRTLALKKLNKDISSEDMESVYAFVNSHSHLDSKSGLVQFDPTLSVSGPDAIKSMLHLIEQSDEKHFKEMCKAVKKQ